MNTNTATITRTAKGYVIDFPTYSANIGPKYTHVVLYTRGGWNSATGTDDLPCFSKHSSLEAARKEAVRYSEMNQADYTIKNLSALP